ncbi:MAG: prepilin-type N-terminal cleavage/methylation domain-containing protein [Candidatus Riflebacteria bacterium]|nr:prepilin-type N-terminal cleavage/methylation domain-containing protein [Candidatus Riflebacteria bacterium]
MIHSKIRYGFSLLEIILALFIFGVAILPLQFLFSEGIDANKAIKEYSTAINLAESQLHKYVNVINNLSKTSTISISKQDDTAEIVSGFADKLKFLNGLKVSSTVQAVPPTLASSAYEITIEVEWNKKERYHLNTIVVQRED